MLEQIYMVIHSLLAMYVHFLSLGLAMNLKARMGISLALDAKHDTRGTKVVLLFLEKKRKVMQMLVLMLLITLQRTKTRSRKWQKEYWTGMEHMVERWRLVLQIMIKKFLIRQ